MTLDEIYQEIKKAEKIVILTHEASDGDAVGSTRAMKVALKQRGKDADVIIPEYSRVFNFFPETTSNSDISSISSSKTAYFPPQRVRSSCLKADFQTNSP